MRLALLVLASLLASTPAMADTLVQFDDGSTAWQGPSGDMYGRTDGTQSRNQDYSYRNYHPSGSAPAGQSAFGSDGRFYAPAGQDQVMDTRTGQFVRTR
ncbi:hypothetical protein [uncultured Thiodictyon sp.]|uniref:hypothetical protein n=1 Tax=uncultured Thiodictyon sp. TaxID=1846217 RepID=UPI0025F0F98C|nr:hypothetical protein [uncultured Thiodictyon sp.]